MLNLVFAQTGESLYITGKLRVEQGLVDGTTIDIFRNGGLLHRVTINRTGSFRVPLDLGQVYQFTFSKDGFYSKTVEIDTRVPADVCDKDCSFPPYQVAVMLYKKVPGVDQIKADIPRISYNPTVDNFDAEALRDASSIADETTRLLNEVKQQSDKYEKESAQLKLKKFNDAIAEADRLKSQQRYEQAMIRYRDALMIFPERSYPRDQVNAMFDVLVAAQLLETIGEANIDNFAKYVAYGDKMFAEKEFTIAKVAWQKALLLRPADEQLKQKLDKATDETAKLHQLAITEINHHKHVYSVRTQKYNELVKQAEIKFNQELLAEALDLFSQAASQIDERSYAVLMVNKIKELMSDDELAQRLAKEREEADKKRLLEARNKAYDDAITEADRMFGERLYHDAIEYYELALTIKSYELYPQNQIRIIRNILAKMQLVGEEYNRLIREADALFNDQKYDDAKSKYQLAHSMIANERYALLKIEEIDRILRKTDIDIELEEKYNALIEKADNLFVEKKYPDAIGLYQDALLLKPGEKYPEEQIRKIREILSRESDAQKRLAQQQNDYDRTIGLADDAFSRQSYSSGRSLYHEALRILPGQVYPKTKIDEIDRLLKEQNDARKNQSILDRIDFSNLQTVSAEEREAAYQEALTLGNQFMASKEWGLARFYFRRALALKPSDDAATAKLNEVEKIIRGDNANEAKYNEMVQRADEAFKTGDFNVARFYYTKAVEANPTDEYANERLKVSNQMVESTAARNVNREYDAAMSKANEARVARNYSVARFFYRKALSHKPNDEEAKQKLYEVEELIRQQ
ncbi:MAG: hypothetical protein JW735_10335 [Prolixibacteraceae bacterium]|nr:hypothetical protein [Prolixibacteraceae bacterium]